VVRHLFRVLAQMVAYGEVAESGAQISGIPDSVLHRQAVGTGPSWTQSSGLLLIRTGCPGRAASSSSGRRVRRPRALK
jgi:hypothetical protein